MIARVTALAARLGAWWQRTLPGRVLARYGRANGGVLTGGIAYSALFSVFAALTIGWTLLMSVVGNDETIRAAVLDAVSESLPGLLTTGGGDEGLLDPDTLTMSSGLSWAGIVAGVVLLVSALAFLGAVRASVRAVFGAQLAPANPVLQQLRQLASLLGIGVAILVSAVGGLAVTAGARWLLGLLGLEEAAGALSTVLGFTVALAADMGLLVLLVVVLAGVRPGRRALLVGTLVGAAALSAVRALGTSVVAGSVEANPLLASVATVAILLLWINLFARIVLYSSALVAELPGGRDPSVESGPADAAADGERELVEDGAGI